MKQLMFFFRDTKAVSHIPALCCNKNIQFPPFTEMGPVSVLCCVRNHEMRCGPRRVQQVPNKPFFRTVMALVLQHKALEAFLGPLDAV
jgi:hypothetical protein